MVFKKVKSEFLRIRRAFLRIISKIKRIEKNKLIHFRGRNSYLFPFVAQLVDNA